MNLEVLGIHVHLRRMEKREPRRITALHVELLSLVGVRIARGGDSLEQ